MLVLLVGRILSSWCSRYMPTRGTGRHALRRLGQPMSIQSCWIAPSRLPSLARCHNPLVLSWCEAWSATWSCRCALAVLCCAVLYCAVRHTLHCTVFCLDVPLCIVLCGAALRCAVLCCAVLCCAVLCCAVPCHAMPYLSDFANRDEVCCRVIAPSKIWLYTFLDSNMMCADQTASSMLFPRSYQGLKQ